ncbi:MAG: hypothetical protein ACK54L_19120, partial [Betaproteobacteria bacterium]
MPNPFFERPILNSPYEYPARHWELDDSGQPTQKVIEARRSARFITPIPKPKKRKGGAEQSSLVFDEGKGLSTQEQQYDQVAVVNAVRQEVDKWRQIKNPNDWRVTPETARLLQHWRHHDFSGIRPFFCQIEAVETAIWLTEVAPQIGKAGETFLQHLANANNDANPELTRLALKLATGAGKTTVMAMLIAWQTINAVRHPQPPVEPVSQAGIEEHLQHDGHRQHEDHQGLAQELPALEGEQQHQRGQQRGDGKGLEAPQRRVERLPRQQRPAPDLAHGHGHHDVE